MVCNIESFIEILFNKIFTKLYLFLFFQSTVFKSWTTFGRQNPIEPEQQVFEKSVFIPLNWTFYLSCNQQGTSKLDTDPASCVFNPIPLSRAPPPSSVEYR